MVSQTDDRPRAVIVGADQVGKKSLARKLLASSGGADVPHTEGVSQTVMAWTLDTKYYTADVALEIHSAYRADHRPLPAATEAVIVLVDAGRTETWEAVRTWVASSSIDNCEIRLCVLNKMDLCTPEVSWVGDMQDWCLEEMFECIQVCCNSEEVDTGLEVDGDPQGVARVVQALQAHMWPGLKMKERNGTAQNQSALTDSAAADTSCEAYADPDTDRKDDTDGQQVQPASVGTNGGADELRDPPEMFLGASVPDMQFADEDDTDEFREIEALMVKLAAEKSKLAGLPDEERRERAADLAMHLASLMGFGGEDED